MVCTDDFIRVGGILRAWGGSQGFQEIKGGPQKPDHVDQPKIARIEKLHSTAPVT